MLGKMLSRWFSCSTTSLSSTSRSSGSSRAAAPPRAASWGPPSGSTRVAPPTAAASWGPFSGAFSPWPGAAPPGGPWLAGLPAPATFPAGCCYKKRTNTIKTWILCLWTTQPFKLPACTSPVFGWSHTDARLLLILGIWAGNVAWTCQLVFFAKSDFQNIFILFTGGFVLYSWWLWCKFLINNTTKAK